MINYKVHICGTVENPDTDFKVGFDLSVENGGSVAHVGNTVQSALESLHSAAVHKLTKKEE